MSNPSRARVAVIGTGWWSTAAHLPSLTSYERAEVVSLVDRDPQKLQRAIGRFGPRNTYTNHVDMLAAESLDGVVVALPHAAHLPVVRDCIAAGVHVFVEKPLALTAADAWLLVHEARRAQLHLMVGYTYQFTNHARLARDAVHSGKLGAIALIEVSYVVDMLSLFQGSSVGDPGSSAELPGRDTYTDPAVAGGGLLQSAVTHALALMLWTSGRRASRVSALMNDLGASVECLAAALVQLDDGGIATVSSTSLVHPGQPASVSVTYHGTKATMVHNLATGKVTVYKDDGDREDSPELAEEEVAPKELPARAFVDLILDGGESPAPGEFAARTVELVEAAYHSRHTGGTASVPVTVPRGFWDGEVVPPDYNWSSLSLRRS